MNDKRATAQKRIFCFHVTCSFMTANTVSAVMKQLCSSSRVTEHAQGILVYRLVLVTEAR